MNEQAWTCVCGRRVPGHIVECRCGMTREQRGSRRSPLVEVESPGSPWFRVALTLAGFAALLVSGWFWYGWFSPREPAKTLLVTAAPQVVPATVPPARAPAREAPPARLPELPAPRWPPAETPAAPSLEPAREPLVRPAEISAESSGESEMERLQRRPRAGAESTAPRRRPSRGWSARWLRPEFGPRAAASARPARARRRPTWGTGRRSPPAAAVAAPRGGS
jgi:hypothetical protein